MTDIVIGIIPKIEPYAPTTGPALLKAHCEAEGFSARLIDYNLRLYRYLQRKMKARKYYEDNDTAFTTWYPQNYEYPDEWEELWNDIELEVKSWVKELLQINPPWVGLSLLSKVSLTVGKKFAELIKEANPNIKIVVGGGATRPAMQQWIDDGIIDYYVYGDGEFNLPALLRGETNRPGINTKEPSQLDDLNKSLFPDYSDIDFSAYEIDQQQNNIVYLTASRGCVKKCTFCDVPLLWPVFKWRSADHIWAEVMLLYHKYGRRTFRFTDSLINGNMKTFRELLHRIKIFNSKFEFEEDKEIKWWSQWIVRGRTQMQESDFRLIAESNVMELDIGIESFSEQVRWHMGKKITDEDLWWNLEMLHKYNIHYTILMITGYPTETAEDHQITLDSIRKMAELGYVNPKSNKPNTAYMSFGNMMNIAIDTKIYHQLKDDPDFSFENDVIWTYKDNTPEERLRRHLEANDLVSELSGQQLSWMERKEIRKQNDTIELKKLANHN